MNELLYKLKRKRDYINYKLFPSTDKTKLKLTDTKAWLLKIKRLTTDIKNKQQGEFYEQSTTRL